jgi:hypothetical protein
MLSNQILAAGEYTHNEHYDEKLIRLKTLIAIVLFSL